VSLLPPCVACAYQCIPFAKNTTGERFKRSPVVLPFGWRCSYFFFATFLAAFFAGAFLAAFLVAIFLFSLSTIFVSSLQTILQLKNV
jgi:hypothetical protein